MSFFDLPYTFILCIFTRIQKILYSIHETRASMTVKLWKACSCFLLSLCFLVSSYLYGSSHLKACQLILFLSCSASLTVLSHIFPFHCSRTQIVHTYSFLIGSALVSRESVVCVAFCLYQQQRVNQNACIYVTQNRCVSNIQFTHTHLYTYTPHTL